MHGFPIEMKSKEELYTFLARFLQLVMHHSASNYPVYPYNMYYPMQAGLLFEPEGEENMLNMMPNATTVIVSENNILPRIKTVSVCASEVTNSQ